LGESKDGIQKMMRLTKLEDGNTTEESFANFSFVPMAKGKEK